MGPSVLNFQYNFRESGNLSGATPESAGPPRNIGQLPVGFGLGATSDLVATFGLDFDFGRELQSGAFSLLMVCSEERSSFVANSRIPKNAAIATSGKTVVSTVLTLRPKLLASGLGW